MIFVIHTIFFKKDRRIKYKNINIIDKILNIIFLGG